MIEVRMVHNLEVLIDHIQSFGGGARDYMADILREAMQDDVKPRWEQHVTLAALSKDELRELDYPYSTRHGKDSGPTPDFDVHEVTGDLVGSTTYQESNVAGNPTIRLVCTSDHYEFIRYGTRLMRMRDPGGEALGEALPAIKQRFAEGVRDATIEFFAG